MFTYSEEHISSGKISRAWLPQLSTMCGGQVPVLELMRRSLNSRALHAEHPVPLAGLQWSD